MSPNTQDMILERLDRFERTLSEFAREQRLRDDRQLERITRQETHIEELKKQYQEIKSSALRRETKLDELSYHHHAEEGAAEARNAMQQRFEDRQARTLSLIAVIMTGFMVIERAWKWWFGS